MDIKTQRELEDISRIVEEVVTWENYFSTKDNSITLEEKIKSLEKSLVMHKESLINWAMVHREHQKELLIVGLERAIVNLKKQRKEEQLTMMLKYDIIKEKEVE